MYTNARSVVNKIDELKIYASLTQPDIIAITETWTNDSVSNHFLTLPDYAIISRHDRNDTQNGRGGGILIYAKESLRAVESTAQCSFNQFSSIEISPPGGDTLSLFVIYRSPNSSSVNNDCLLDVLKLAKNSSLVVGDFNYPNINWESFSGPNDVHSFIELVSDKFWNQHVDFATHRNGNVLDLIFAESGMITEVTNDGQLGNSDHCIITFTTNKAWVKKHYSQPKYNFSRADTLQMRRLFKGCNWTEALDTNDINTAWLNFKSIYNSTVSQCVPLMKANKKKRPAWMDKSLLSSIRQKQRLWKTYKATPSVANLSEFKSAEKALKKKIRKAKLKYEESLAKNAKENPKAFYAYVGSKRSNKTGIGPLEDSQGRLISDDSEMATLLNDYYSSVFENESAFTSVQADSFPGPSLETLQISPLLVKQEMLRLKRHCSPGPDGIASFVLIEACEELVHPLTQIFKLSLRKSTVPDDWKVANITPIHKSGSVKLVSNYRPISLTSIVSKLLEKLLKAAIMKHVMENELLNSSQHGFMAKKSCLTNLLHCLEEVTAILDSGDCVDILYLDFAKAFDKVQHKRLLSKLEALNIKGEILAWIKAWLSNRKHRVVLNGKQSDWCAVPCSVPQGSVLGPILFIIYINDIDGCIEDIIALLLKFADDTKVIKRISTVADNLALQDVINNLMAWAKKWQMSFNVGKCKILHLGNNNPQFVYNMEGVTLNVTSNQKDLGVFVDQSAKPSLQVSKAAQKANQVLGRLLRSFKCREKTTMVQLYKTFVRPHLEYAIQAWCPYTIKDIDTLEKVQKRFVRQITSLSGTYEEKLLKIGLTSLRDRRTRGDCIETFKMLRGFTKVDKSTWLTFLSREVGPQTRLSSDPLSLETKPARLDLRKHFFSVRIPTIWNALPLTIRQSTSVNQFKALYDKFQKNQSA